MSETHKPIEIFCSYAHEDEFLLKKFETHLSLLKRQGLVAMWHHREITPGTEWAQVIDAHLNSASVILLLISPDFFASDYCYGIEMTRALERHRYNEARVIPILLRPVDWHGAPFAHLQALPTNTKPVTTWSNSDQAFVDIATGIRRAIGDLGQLASSAPASERQGAGNYQVTNDGMVQGQVVGDHNVVHQHFSGRSAPWTEVTVGLQRVIEASSRPSASASSKETDFVPRREGEKEASEIITSDSLPQTSSTFRLRRGGSPDLPLVIETHARLITIGRAPKNMVRLSDEIVSWEHGMILFKEGEYFYCHLSKSKPTTLRRRGLEQLFRAGKQEETALRNQDRLIIGKTIFIIECDLINEDGRYRTTAGTEEEENDAG